MRRDLFVPTKAANINAAPAQPKLDLDAMAFKLASACMTSNSPREASS